MPPFIGKLALVENASSARSDEGSKERCEKRYAKLNYCALKVSQDHVVALFRREYLDALLSYENPPEACTLLIKCVDAYERIQKLEETLDKMHFTELLRKGCMGMLSGTDKKGNNILWMQSPPGMSSYKKGSPLTDAYVRAAIYTIQIALIRIAPKYKLTIMYDDMSRTLLGFNSKVARELTSITFAAFPLAAETVYYFAPRGTRAAWSGISGIFSLRNKSTATTIVTNKDKAINFVSDPSEIPSFWMDGQANGVPYVPNWDNLWDFHRCLSKGNASLSVSEVFHCQPWCRSEAEEVQPTNVLIQPLRRSLDKRESGGVTIVDEKVFDDKTWNAPARMIHVNRTTGVPRKSNPLSPFSEDDDGLDTIQESDDKEEPSRTRSATLPTIKW